MSCVSDPGFSEIQSSIDDNRFELRIAPDSLKRITKKLEDGFRWLGIECADFP